MRFSPLLLVFVALTASSAQSQDVPADHVERARKGAKIFKEVVRPTLVSQCLSCHGGKETKGDFDLSTRKKLIDSGFVAAYKPSESHLLAVVWQQALFRA